MDSDGEAFHINADGDTDSVDFRLGPDDVDTITHAETSSLFGVDYLKRLVRTIPKETVMTVDVGTQFPAVLSHDLADDAGSMTRMLAPPVET